nr:7637_t:CDS:2 [Entrophospora candida]
MNKLANAITIKSAEALAKSCSNLLDNKEDEDDTPLVKIKSLSKAIGCEILGKAELKRSLALNMIKITEEKGLIKPNTGCAIFEGMSGSTGIPIAMISCAKGYNAWIIIPDDQAEEKYQLLEK